MDRRRVATGSVEVVDRSAHNLAVVGIVVERDGTAELIDRTGEVHSELPPRRVTYEVVLMREDAEAPWRVISTGDERPVPEDADGGED